MLPSIPLKRKAMDTDKRTHVYHWFKKLEKIEI